MFLHEGYALMPESAYSTSTVLLLQVDYSRNVLSQKKNSKITRTVPGPRFVRYEVNPAATVVGQVKNSRGSTFVLYGNDNWTIGQLNPDHGSVLWRGVRWTGSTSREIR